MVRLSDLPEATAKFYQDMEMPALPLGSWTPAPPLSQARVAIVTTAGIHRRGEPNFRGGAGDYRVLPGDIEPGEIVMSHVSVNFDRSAFQQDLNTVFPLEHLETLAAEGTIASVASWHYAFMGATDPTAMEPSAREVARLLKEDGVNAALLVPV
ncbi:MAG: selenoprotein B glycine/betaine/sarcosine/D-proline reductase [Dehalococcoidia bacterium]|nr:selenoprotein B glycine/betaine/sarcosine/D-proline reductase [Dehalococcoidia bacterium]